MAIHLPPASIYISGITSITVAALWSVGPWALPLAFLGMWFIRPDRNKGKRKEEE